MLRHVLYVSAHSDAYLSCLSTQTRPLTLQMPAKQLLGCPKPLTRHQDMSPMRSTSYYVPHAAPELQGCHWNMTTAHGTSLGHPSHHSLLSSMQCTANHVLSVFPTHSPSYYVSGTKMARPLTRLVDVSVMHHYPRCITIRDASLSAMHHYDRCVPLACATADPRMSGMASKAA